MAIITCQRPMKLFLRTWKRHHLMIAFTVVSFLSGPQSLIMNSTARHHGKPRPQRDASWLQCTLRNQWAASSVEALFCRRRHQPRRPALAKIRPGRPAPAMGAGTVLNCRSNTALVPIPQVSPLKLRKMLLDVNVASAPLTPAAVVAEFRVIPAMSVFLETSTNSNPLKELATKK